MSRVKWTVVLVVFAGSLACAPVAEEATAAVVSAAPVWPIPAGAPAGPPPIPSLPVAGDTSPPADQIADPVRPAAVCGGWHQQASYGDRWPAGSAWWEYRCSDNNTVYYPDPCGSGGGGACQPVCYGYPFNCYTVSEDWRDYFYWDGSRAVFVGQSYSSAVYDDAGFSAFSAAWWDAPTAQWYLINAYPLSVARQGSGSGVVSSSPAGISCGSSCQESVDAGASVTLTATPDASSVFSGWSGDCSGTGACELTMDQARSVWATFEPKRFTLTVATAGTGGGLVYMSPGSTGCRSCQQGFDIGTSVTLTPAPDASSVFTGWSGDCSGSGACQVTMDRARSVTATFAAKAFSLGVAKTGSGSGSVSSSPVGISCGSSCQAGFDAGISVALTATPEASSIFTGWSGDCSGTGACIVTMDKPRSVTATFALNTPPHASFTVACTRLSCSFDGSGSADLDGSIATYAWEFGDGGRGNGQTISHTYGRAGKHTITLTVTDNHGAADSSSKAINPITLSARGYKLKGLQKADLSWDGPSGTSFDVYRNGAKIATVGTIAYTDNINKAAPGTYTYTVCAAGTAICSNTASVSF
jgi:PKD repeat protein